MCVVSTLRAALPSFGFSIMQQALYRYSNAGSSGFSVSKAPDLAMDQCQIILLLRRIKERSKPPIPLIQESLGE